MKSPAGPAGFPLEFDVLRHRVALGHPAFAVPVGQVLGHHTLGQPSMTLQVVQGVASCDEAGVVVRTMHGPLELAVQGNAWALSGGRVRGRFSVAETELALPLSPTPTEHVAQYLALQEAGRAAGLLPLHAAVLSREGRAVALLGDSGAGKSTATLRLLELGWNLVAEDSAWLCVETGQIAGAGSGLRVWRASLERFAPHWLTRDLPRDLHGKYLLPVTNGEPATLGHVYLLSAAAEPLNAAAALKFWWAATGLPVTPLARQVVSRELGKASRRYPLEPVQRDALIQILA